MKYITVLLLFIFYGKVTNAQSLFDSCLTLNKDTGAINPVKLKIDSLKKVFEQSQDSSYSFNLSDTWRLQYIEGLEWMEMIPRPKSCHHYYFIADKNAGLLTAEAILDTFKITDSLSRSNHPLKYFPSAYERDDPSNGDWVAIFPHPEYLIIHYGYGYLYGSQTSWYSERLYYYKKEN